jgi:hypothetical protein
METAVYEIVGGGNEWFVLHDDDRAGPYVTKEAAFEAAIPAASLSIHDGLSVQLNVPAGQNSPDAEDIAP